MTDNIELLPLPEWMSRYVVPSDGFEGGKVVMLDDRMRDYARANLAALQAENERLRAEVAEWKRVASAQAELHGEAEDRAEKLLEALKRIRAAASANAYSNINWIAHHAHEAITKAEDVE